MDWSERKFHTGGALGAALLKLALLRGWLRSDMDSRAVTITPTGHRAFNRLLKYPTQKCDTLLGTFDFHATLSYRELPALFEADFIGLSLVFPHFPRLTLSADGFAPACACA
jgi:hypothetical protein